MPHPPLDIGRMSRALFRLAAFLATLAPAHLLAQVGGVVESAGAPVPDATVELWNAAAVRASVTTAPDGSFLFTREAASDARFVVVRRIGYETVRREAAPGDLQVRVVLATAAVALPELHVEGSRRICPRPEDPAARAVWRRTAARYSPETRRRGFDALVWSVTEHLPETKTGEVDDTRLRPGGRVWSGDSTSVFDANARIRDEGYARPLPWNRPGYQPLYADYFAWRYAELHAYEAYHFASAEFGARHTIAFLSRSSGAIVLSFCPVRRDQPYIEGWLALARDSSFEAAEWRFSTSRPDEDAGGRVVFDTAWVPGEALPHLVPGRGVFWRRMAGRSLFYQSAAEYPAWVVSVDRSRPEIGRRAGRAGAGPPRPE